MRELLVLLAILLFLLPGCMTKYCHPYKDVTDFERDKYDCQMKTRSGSAEMMLVDFDHFGKCMRIEKGWGKCSQ